MVASPLYTIQILDGGESTIHYTNIGWWRVHYTVYGTKKSDNGRGEAESIIAFLRPVNCIVDELPSNICYVIHIGKILTMLL